MHSILLIYEHVHCYYRPYLWYTDTRFALAMYCKLQNVFFVVCCVWYLKKQISTNRFANLYSSDPTVRLRLPLPIETLPIAFLLLYDLLTILCTTWPLTALQLKCQVPTQPVSTLVPKAGVPSALGSVSVWSWQFNIRLVVAVQLECTNRLISFH